MSLSKLGVPRPPMADLYDAHDPALVGVPRLIRHATQAINCSIQASVAVELAIICPEMAREADAWANRDADVTWQALAARLDERAIRDDKPALRGLADSVRLASMTLNDAFDWPDDALRLSRSLQAAKSVGGRGSASAEMLAAVERCMVGWLYIATGAAPHGLSGECRGHAAAHEIGLDLTEAIEIAAKDGPSAHETEPLAAGEVVEAAAESVDPGGPVTVPGGRVVAGVNLALQARDWSTQRIVRELQPALLETCAEISALGAGAS